MSTKEPRPKFAERKFQLSGEDIRERAMALLQNLPIDTDRPLEVVFRERVDARRAEANAYYWLRLGEIAKQAYFQGKKYPADVWHEYARRHLMPDEVTLKNGTVRTKWIEVPRGEPAIVSTTDLEKKCFSEYVQAVEAFGASLGVKFSANPRDYK
jgi:hypothetical protein